MSRPSQEKCRLCSKLSVTEAKLKHGMEGDRCWDDERCHNRRSYYRHRGVRNYNRKQHRRTERSPEQLGTSAAILSIPAPAAPAAVAHFYRETKDSPLHAFGAELWMGNHRVAKIEPVHCLGLAEAQVKMLLVRVLEGFSSHSGVKIERFRSTVELHPVNCPIRPCPMHPNS